MQTVLTNCLRHMHHSFRLLASFVLRPFITYLAIYRLSFALFLLLVCINDACVCNTFSDGQYTNTHSSIIQQTKLSIL